MGFEKHIVITCDHSSCAARSHPSKLTSVQQVRRNLTDLGWRFYQAFGDRCPDHRIPGADES